MIMSDFRPTECLTKTIRMLQVYLPVSVIFTNFSSRSHLLYRIRIIKLIESSSISILGDYHLISAISRCIGPNYIHFTVLTSRVAVGVTILLWF